MKQPENRPHNDVPVKDVASKVVLDHLNSVQSNIRAQLDILRRTRGQRNVGEVRIPAHLRADDFIDDSGVESRGMIVPILGPRD